MIAQAVLVLSLVLGLGAAGTGLYVKGRHDGRAIEQATDLREREIARMAADTAAAAAAKAISGIKVQNRTINNEVQREISERLVYRDCQHSPEQLQRINAALTGAQPEPAGRGLVPGADAARGSELRGDDAEAGGGGGAVPGVPGGGGREVTPQ